MAEQFDPRQWLDAVDAQWNAHNLESALAYFHDDAVVRMIPAPPGEKGEYVGKAEIREWIGSLFAQQFQVDSHHHRLSGGRVSWLAHARWDTMTAIGVTPFAADCEAVVEGGKMRSFTINVRPETLARLQVAIAAAQG